MMISENNMRKVLDAFPFPTIILMPSTGDFIIAGANASYLKLTGKEAGDIMGKPYFDIFFRNVDPGNADALVSFRTALKRAEETGLPQRTEKFKYLTFVPDNPNPEITYWDIQDIPVLDDTGKTEYILHTVENVTQKVTSRHEAEFMMENTEDSFIMVDRDLDIVFFNKKFAELYEHDFGKKVEKGNSILEYSLPGRKKTTGALYRKVLTGTTERIELEVMVRGALKAFLVTYKPSRDEKGEINGVFVSSIDVTQEKRSAKQAQESELRFRSLIEHSHDMITLLDAHGIIQYISPAVERVFGYRSEELLSKHINEITHPDDQETARTVSEQLFSNPGMAIPLTLRNKNKDGSYIWVEGTLTNMLDVEGVKAVVANFRDITVRRESEKKLSSSYKEISDYKFALDQSSIVAITDRKGIIKYVNENFCKISKYSEEELIGQDHRIINSDFHTKEFFKDLWTTIGHGRVWRGEIKNRAKDGTYYWVDTTIVPFLDDKGRPYQYVAIRTDITENMLAGEELRSSNERFNYLAKASFDAIWDWDLVNDTIYWGDGFETIFGYKPEDMLPSGDAWIEYIHPEDKERIIRSLYSAIEGNSKDWLDEYRYLKSNGSYAFVQDRGIILRNEDGKAVRMIGAMQNITQRKEDEAELKLLEEEKAHFLSKIIERDALMRTAEELAGFGTWEADLLTGKNTWSTGSYLMYGYAPNTAEPGYELFLSHVHPDDLARVRNEIEHALTALDFYENEFRIIDNHGILKHVLSKINIERDADGRPFRMIGFGLDISQRKKQEQEIADHNRKIRAIFDSISDAFYALDQDWNFTYFNKEAENLLGITAEQAIGNNVWDLFPAAKDSQVYEKFIYVKEHMQPLYFENYFHPLDAWYDVSAYPADQGVSVYFKDINERKRHEAELRELNEELQKRARSLAISNSELEQFAYVASHDLQEPLRMVTGFLSQIEKKYNDVLDEKGKQYIYFAVDGAIRMRQIILDLLEFSRVGRVAEEKEKIVIDDLLNNIITLNRKVIAESSAEISWEAMPEVKTTKIQLQQVFQNLISNAIKYRQAGVRPKISISASENEKEWKFSVRDNGIGIEPDYFEKIFVIFQRLHSKEEYSGTGMGLAICKKIIENQGGKIWVESQKGQGSEFHFTILKSHTEI